MKYVILDKRTPKKAISTLEQLGFTPLLLPAFSRLAEPVSCHPDMLIYLGDKLFCNREYYFEAKNELDRLAKLCKLEIELGEESISSKYPHDIAYNALSVGGFLFGKLTALSKSLTDYAERCGLLLVDVKQGYTKCSVCKVSEKAIITSDESIKKAALTRGLDVLTTEKGSVLLNGYDFGFIGGASGCDDENVYFCGSLESHPNSREIKEFCKKYGKNTVSLSDEPLYDVGTMLFVQSE